MGPSDTMDITSQYAHWTSINSNHNNPVDIAATHMQLAEELNGDTATAMVDIQ